MPPASAKTMRELGHENSVQWRGERGQGAASDTTARTAGGADVVVFPAEKGASFPFAPHGTDVLDGGKSSTCGTEHQEGHRQNPLR